MRLPCSQPDMLVGLGTEHSVEMIVGMLAILKVGAAYVPMDPAHPDDRLVYMLSDAKITLLLTQTHLVSRWKSLRRDEEIFVLSLDETSTFSEFAQEDLLVTIQPNSLAYVLYTSGTTGKPKGVMITQHSLVNLVFAMNEKLSMKVEDKFLALTSMSFDIAELEWHSPLIVGASIILANQQQVNDVEMLIAYLKITRPSVMQATPSRWEMLLEAGWQSKTSVKILVGGEALNQSLATKLLQQSEVVWNVYGPTETTIWSSCARVQNEQPIHIGEPLANTQFYVLNEALGLLPIGVAGELYIGGTGLARGYLNRPDLTVERFIEHQFDKYSAPTRLYRTGDLVRYLPDGNIEYIGRTDNQIKIRGFRVELEEIEAQLLKQPNISNAVVIAREAQIGNKQLIAYIVSNEAIDTEALNIQLSAFLPEYMIPTYVMQLEKMPLNVNGKVDRKALPAVDASTLVGQSYTAPKTETEKKLAAIFAELLHLPVGRIGLNDNFFHLGGHSLLSMSLLNRIKREWQSELSLKALFDSPSIESIARLIEHTMSNALSIPVLTKQRRPEHIPLSFSQQRLWFLEQLLPGKALYQVPLALRLNGHCNISALSQAYQTMIVRQESLRTRFEFVDGIAGQVIDSPEVIPGLSVCENIFSNQEALRTYLEASLLKPFNLREGQLIRGEVITLIPDREYVLFIVMHHIITDGWSMQCYMKELAHLYRHYNNQSVPMLEPLPVQYVDYTLWQQSWLQGTTLERQLDYWKQQLSGIPDVITLPTDYARPKELTYVGGRIDFDLSGHEIEILKNCAKENNATLFMVLLSALQIVLHRYSQQETIVVGSPIANRGIKETEHLIGFFVNTLALKADFSKPSTLSQFIAEVRETTLEAYSHQDASFEQIVNHLEISRQINVNPIFQVMLAYQESQEQSSFDDELRVSSLTEGDYPIAKFDLALDVMHDESGLHCNFEYSKDLFRKASIERFIVHFRGMIQHLTSMSEQFIYELPLLTKEEIHQQLVTWNDTARPYPGITIHELFEAQVARTPDAIALVYEDQGMTYRELNIRANQVAHYLRKQGIGSQPDMLVGLGVERSMEMMIGILGVLKAGGAYVPFDPGLADERLRYMLEDTKIVALLIQERLRRKWEALVQSKEERQSCLMVSLDDVGLYADTPNYNLTSASQPHYLAYVIYTSGSTGAPKGVMLEHGGLVNLCIEVAALFQVLPKSNVLQFSSMNFDAMVWEWTSTLTQGAVLHLPSSRYPLLESIEHVLKAHPIEITLLTPSVLRQFSETDLVHLKTLAVGGEALDKPLFERWRHRCRFINAYGPTEATVISSVYVDTLDCIEKIICIGRPIGNTQLYVLGADQELVPLGAIGELYISGSGLARGYLNRPDLTAERFVEHQFDKNSPPIRLYRTGDLVRYLPDGNIEYIGRTDNQIKIRGFRVELEEIETQLSKQSNILNAVVIARETQIGNKQLIAYIVSNETIDTEALKVQLRAFLPEYMIPTYIIQLKKMPLNINGKVDRKALPEIDATTLMGQSYIAPKTETEIELAKLWSKLLTLPVEIIGTTDNFFEKGGNSILAMQFVFQAKHQLHIETTITQFYQNPTIEALIRASSNGLISTFDASILPISVQRIKKPIFLIHPIGGLATSYRNLLPSLDGNYAIYGVNYPNLMEGEIVTYNSLEALAADYIQRIKTVSPEGPYCLGGWSLGGNIALEMTRQLQASGEIVELLLFLDTGYQPYKEQIERGYTEIFMNELLVALDPEFAVQSNIASRIVEISYHLYLLLHAYEAKQIEAVNKVLYVKCQGSLVTLASQHKENLDWPYSDVLNGLRYFRKRRINHII